MPVTLQPTSLKYKNSNGTFQSATCIKGEGGYSPTIAVTDITGGHRVTITDTTGPHSFDVMDGQDGGGTVQDVQVNGVSVLTDGVANVPKAANSSLGVCSIGDNYGIDIGSAGNLYIKGATSSDIKNGTHAYKPIIAATQHMSTFYGLAKAAGDTSQSASSNAVGTYTDAAKSAIQKMFGVNRAFELITRVTIDSDIPVNSPLIINTDSNSESFALDAVNAIVTVPATTATTMNGHFDVMKNGISTPVGLRFNNFGHASYAMNNLVSFSLLRHGQVIADLKSQINSANSVYFGLVKWTPDTITADYIYSFGLRDNIIPAGTIIEIWGHRI